MDYQQIKYEEKGPIRVITFNRLWAGEDSRAEFEEGLRRFNERDHPDRIKGDARTPGIIRAELEE